jgi:hypothetical protein
MTSDDLRRPRLDPRAIVRDTWEIVRRHWRPLILIAAGTDALHWGILWTHNWAIRTGAYPTFRSSTPLVALKVADAYLASWASDSGG